MGFIVQKFGGWAVANQHRIEKSAQMVLKAVQDGHQVVVVVSAMGKQTDELQQLADRYHRDPPAREVDVLLSSGERMTMALFSMTLDALGVRALSLTGSQSGILTNSTHRNAKIEHVRPYRVREALDQGYVVVVAGFQGVSHASKNITTLGRGGSDLTAVALAVELGADVCQLYKGVNGFMTADPREISDARNIPQLSWSEACALAWSGAGILHHRGAELAKAHQMPIELCALQEGGVVATQIAENSAVEAGRVAAVTHEDHLVLLRVEVTQPQQKWLSILEWLWQLGESTLLCRQEGSCVVVSVQQKYFQNFLEFLGNDEGCRVLSQQPCCVISLVGTGLRGDVDLLCKVLLTLEEHALCVDVQEGVLRLGVPIDQRKDLMLKLHQEFFSE